MSQSVERYLRVCAGFTSRLSSVGADQWSLPTPCEDWDVATLVCHVIDMQWRVGGSIDRKANSGGDLVDQWREASTSLVEELKNPQRAAAVSSGMFGEQTFEDLVGTLVCADALYHTWDLARATGQSEDLDEEAVMSTLEFLAPLDQAIRRPGGFAPKITSPPLADLQTRFLNFGGRAP